jgi:hypothetical protein
MTPSEVDAAEAGTVEEVRMGSSAEGEIEAAPSKMGKRQYFRVSSEWICVEFRVAEGQASCCGVNLAVAGLGVGVL